jgi:mono/diheme cytochrome c family protein
MSLRWALFLLLVGALLSASAAFAEEAPADSPGELAEVDPLHAEKMKAGLELFKVKIRSVLAEKCVDCHGGDDVQSGFDLATRKGLIRGGSKGKAVIAGKPDDSRLIALISHNEDPHMPEGGDKLPAGEIAAIRQWIELGAPYDAPLVDNPRDPDAWVNRELPPKAREFWSFRPLVRHAPPEVKKEAWPKTPIDRFVLATLEEKGLAPNPPVDRRQLIRRAYFDLIGLPPLADEVEAFVADRDPEAYSKLLDRLLESPHFGERWGRYWLDTARFAESHGFEQDYDRPFAYHFRDFVIEALNQDMPYDQFVRWQLAGDELAPENPLALKATGFLGAGVFPTQITANEVERSRYDALDDMAATTGTAFLGLTIGCARCHDHKFDPIPQADYYRLASTFTTTVRSNLEVDLEPEKTRAALAAWEQLHEPLVAALQTYESGDLSKQFTAWLDADGQLEGSWRKTTDWIVLDAVEAKSKNGATLTLQDDGSIVSSEANPDTDLYTIAASSLPSGPITTIRLEALPDASMVKEGPGRADNGNFALSRIRLFAEQADGSERREIKLVNPRADFQQNDSSLSIAASLDEDPKTGWAIDPQFGQRHVALFDIDPSTPLKAAEGVRLVSELDFQVNVKHTIGRLRLSYASASKQLKPEGTSLGASVARALDQVSGYGSAIIPGLDDESKAALQQHFRRLDPKWRELNAAVVASLANKPKPQLTQMMVCSEGVTPIRHHTQGADFFNEFYFLKRGDVDQKQGLASQSFLQVLMTSPERENRWIVPPPEDSKLSYRRTSLANWITDTEQGAGHLLARVIVNRIWQGHFGRGLVSTPNDFGAQGKPPSHPELLDYLALDLMENSWRMKRLHKLMMLSSAYQQSASARDDALKLDPENEWLWRYTPRRLEAEVIRDSLLTVSGELDRTQFGPGTLDQGHKRRSIYFMVKRSQLIPMMQLFDQPEPLVSVGNRPSTTIAPQALALMNSPHVRGYALAFGARVEPEAGKSLADAVTLGYLTALGRQPDDEELAASVAFVESQVASYAEADKANPRHLALADFCQVLFGLNEFVYVE